MSDRGADARSLFLPVYASLIQLESKSLPLEQVCLDECDRQLQLGKRFIEELIHWSTVFPGKADEIDAAIMRDVRRIMIRHTKWFITFVGVCVIDRSSPMLLTDIEWGIDVMMERLQGVDSHLDFWLRMLNQSREVQLLRTVVSCFLAENSR